MAMFKGLKAVVWCGSVVNNSKVVGVVFVGVAGQVGCDDRSVLVCG